MGNTIRSASIIKLARNMISKENTIADIIPSIASLSPRKNSFILHTPTSHIRTVHIK